MGGVYLIGKQNNGEKILGTFYFLVLGTSHGGFSRAGGGTLAWLMVYNFAYLDKAKIPNERVARDNVIGLSLVFLLEALANDKRSAVPADKGKLGFGLDYADRHLWLQIRAPLR